MENKIENLFTSKSYKFDTGITINVNKDSVLSKYDIGHASIDSQHIDNFSYQEYWEERISPGGLWFRFIALSIVLVILSDIIFGGWSVTSWGFFGVMLVINFLVFLAFVFDGLLELDFFRGIIKIFFSNHVYLVTIGNKSGNNIVFYALLDEKNKLIELEKSLANLKLLIANETNKSIIKNDVLSQQTSNLDELIKLGELYKNGIITEQEFNIKKQELLKNV